ncbi:MAG: peptidase M28, partial [Rudanella sp.]|nr:peptidase M28 [Rudanella sp.]
MKNLIRLFPLRFVAPLLFSLITFSSFSQVIVNRDPQIVQMLGEISADSLRAHIDGLVRFGTRNTLSSQNSTATRGITPARQWVLRKFEQYARQSGGRLTATLDTWTLPADGRRVNKPTEIANVMATL